MTDPTISLNDCTAAFEKLISPLQRYPHDRATGFVIHSLFKDGGKKWSGFGAGTLKERLEVAAHYSGHGLEFEI